MSTSKILHQYKNGNVLVTLYADGTKIREWEGEQEIETSESTDLKVTNRCSLGDKFSDTGELLARSKTCEFCHEMSNNIGSHGDLNLIEKIWSTHQEGTELAIGGGNVMEHPDILPFLTRMSVKGFMLNITMNTLHMKPYANTIRELQESKCIRGLGISYRGPQYMDKLPDNVIYDNAVFHLILGLNNLKDCKAVIDWCKPRHIQPKILLLGYKQFGNGIGVYNAELQKEINKWKIYLPMLMSMGGLTISFDNLAIKQIGVQNYMSKEDWQLLYAGNDGSHTQYCCAVTQTFAKTSTSYKKYPLSMVNNTREMMVIIHEEMRQDNIDLQIPQH